MKKILRRARKKHQTNSLKYKVINILRINQLVRKQNLHRIEIDIIKSILLKSSKLLSYRKINNIIKLNKTYQNTLVDMFTKSFGLELSPVINYDKPPKGNLYYMDFVKYLNYETK